MEQKWISVSERLPKKNKKVIISTKTENLYFGIYCQNVDSTKDGIFLFLNNACMRMDMVAAWMPLPEPYRGEEPKQTNADRIRSMTDEELADFLVTVETYGYHDQSISGNYEMNEWLRAESEG